MRRTGRGLIGLAAIFSLALAGCSALLDTDSLKKGTVDTRARDKGVDVAVDMKKDIPVVDKPKTEAKIPDLKVDKPTTTDVKVPDQKVPDQKVPDVKIPDVKVPDVKIPDEKVPDQKVPDQKVPDQKVPDQKVPDSAPAVDQTLG